VLEIVWVLVLVYPERVAGMASIFTLQSRDIHLNTRAAGGDVFTLRLRKAGVSDVDGTVVDNGDGTYSASYTVLSSGRWELAVESAGVGIYGSPWYVIVNANTTIASSCEASIDSGLSIKAGGG
jgi:hypothetical protein